MKKFVSLVLLAGVIVVFGLGCSESKPTTKPAAAGGGATPAKTDGAKPAP